MAAVKPPGGMQSFPLLGSHGHRSRLVTGLRKLGEIRDIGSLHRVKLNHSLHVVVVVGSVQEVSQAFVYIHREYDGLSRPAEVFGTIQLHFAQSPAVPQWSMLQYDR